MFDAKGLVGMLLLILILIEYTRKKVSVFRTFERQSIQKKYCFTLSISFTTINFCY